MIGGCVNLQMLEKLFSFFVLSIIFVFIGVLTIEIKNSYVLQENYEPRSFGKARCSETSRFSITKIWYAYSYVQ